MAAPVKVTFPSGAVVTCSPEQAKKYGEAPKETRKTPAKKVASSKSQD